VKNNVDRFFMIFTRRPTHSFALLSAIFVSKHAVVYMKLYKLISCPYKKRARVKNRLENVTFPIATRYIKT